MTAKDAGKKQDQPSADAGSGTAAKEELETKQAAEAVAKDEAATKAKPKKAPAKKPAAKKPAAKKAEGTAAAKTKVEKPAAEAATKEGSSEPTTKSRAARPAAKPAAKPAPKRSRRREAPSAVTVRAHAKYVRSSARKARLVADHVRGKSVDEARAILAFSPRAVSEPWRKLLESAVANAEHNHDLVGDDLRVLTATADEGPTLKRFQPRAMGRATKIRKRTSHLTITLSPKE